MFTDLYVKKFRVLSLVIFLGLAYASNASAATNADCNLFSRNLTVGASGSDVKLLQQILNMNSATVIAPDGPGAPYQETTYFGSKTKAALIKFQDLYKSEVLTPVGLTHGTGYAGIFTRAKLLVLCFDLQARATGQTGGTIATDASTMPGVRVASSLRTTVPSPTTTIVPSSVSYHTSSASLPTPPQVVAPTSPPVLPQGSASLPNYLTSASSNDPLSVRYPSSYTVAPGGKLSIYGGGFAATGNTLHIGTSTFPNLSPDSSGALTVTIPQNETVGRQDLWITNSKGESNKSFVIITNVLALRPTIVNFTPKQGMLGTVVTVTGQGFSRADNAIYFATEIMHVASPDGKTLQFTVTAHMPGIVEGQVDIPNMDFSAPVWFYIANEGGISDPAIFTVKA